MDVIAQRYLRFADSEAAGKSSLYEALARHVAEAPAALAFLGNLPPERRQPNLFFAALRLMSGTPDSIAEFDRLLHTHAKSIAEIMQTRTTQTNEPGRCATLLPFLSRIKGPIALIEVGASAGLCLLPDLYAYDWGRQRLAPSRVPAAAVPLFPCEASDNILLPSAYPEIIWRAGLDLNPLDLSNDQDVAWLEHLVWPEHHERLARLRAAISIARANPPRVVQGDLRRDVRTLIAEAPADATVVVFHTAVLSYIPDQTDRDEFARQMVDAGVLWLCNEAPGVFPQFARQVASVLDDMFLLTANGKALAWTDPHGRAIRNL